MVKVFAEYFAGSTEKCHVILNNQNDFEAMLCPYIAMFLLFLPYFCFKVSEMVKTFVEHYKHNSAL